MIIVPVVADSHTNSSIGLCPPVVNLDDGGTYHASPGQRWLYDNWLRYWDDVDEIAKRNTADIYTVINGDAGEIDHKVRTTQLITRNKANVLRMMSDVYERPLLISRRIFVIRGTAAHTGPSAELEEEFAYDIEAEKDGERAAWWQLRAEFGGVQFFIQHHGRLGGRLWTKSNSLNTVAVEVMLTMPEVQVYVQSHNHTFADTGMTYPVRVIASPAWQLATEYTYRNGRFGPADVGGLLFMCEGGEYEMKVIRYKPERPKVWVIH